MNRQEFLLELHERMLAVRDEDRKKALSIYSRLIDSAIEEGTSEEDIIAAIDTPEQIAKRYIEELPFKELIKSSIVRKKFSVSAIVLMVVLVPFIIGAVFTVTALYLSIWTVIATVYITAIAVGVFGLMLLVAAFDMAMSDFLRAAAFFGAGLAHAGMAVFVFMFAMFLSKMMNRLTHYIIRLIKRQLIQRGVCKWA